MAAGAAALALGLALTGCSGDSHDNGGSGKGGSGHKSAVAKQGPTGTEAISVAQTHLKELKSVSLKGDIAEDGSKLKIDGKGSTTDDGDFSLSMSGNVDGQTMDVTILHTGDAYYVKATEEFYKKNLGDASGKMAKAIGDKYLEVPKEQSESLKSMSLSSLMHSVFDPDEMKADDLKDASKKGKLVDFEGQQAYEYATNDGDGTNLYLTADGSEQFAGMKSAKEGTMAFSEHNKNFTFKAPSKDKVASMADLQKAMQ